MQNSELIATPELADSGLLAGRYICGVLRAKTANACVYQGWDKHDGRQVILKKLRNPTPPRISAFHREGRLLQINDHASLINGDGYVQCAQDHWLVLNPAKGFLLLDLLQSGQVNHWPESLKRRVVTHLAEAVQHLHNSGWGHGDLKPDNIFVAPEYGTVQLIDYSATRLLGEEFTCPYYTPEWQHPDLCEGIVSEGIDNYALALLTWSVWTGAHPFVRYETVNFNKPPVRWSLKKGNWLNGRWLRRQLKEIDPPSLHSLEQRFGIGRLLNIPKP